VGSIIRSPDMVGSWEYIE